MAPADVNLRNERNIWHLLYSDVFDFKSVPVRRANYLQVGDTVQLSKRKHTFEKAYFQNWTDEVFFISLVSKRTKPPTYRLMDSAGEPLEGTFYRPELALIKRDDDVFAIEEVIKEETRKDGRYLFVKWRGYPDSQNSWIRADQFLPITKAV